MNAMGSIDSRISALVKPSANRKSVSADGELANKFKNLLDSKAEMALFRQQELGGSSQTTSSSGRVVKQDKLTINGYGDITYKLGELQKIHEETDYSGMSDVEIYRTIRGRFERAFPNLQGKKVRDAYPRESNEIMNLQQMQYAEKIKDKSIHDAKGAEERSVQNRAYFGYEGLTDAEILEMHQKRFENDSSIDAKGQFLYELWSLGVIDGNVVGCFGTSASRECSRAYRAHYNTNVDPMDLHNDWKVYEFGSRNMNWSEAKSLIFNEKDIVEYYGKEVMKNIEELFDMLAEEENKRMGIR